MKSRKGFTIVELVVVLVIVAILVAIPLGAVQGCRDRGVTNGADVDQARKTAQAMQEANAQVGMPALVNYQEKKLAKMLYELRDQENLICYAYLKSLEGKAIYLGKCIGYGLPYCVQFSNPERVVELDRAAGFNSIEYHLGKLPQPEPNGLFMPQSLSATWLMMIDPETGDARPVYIEPEILVSPFPLPQGVGGPEI